VGDQTYEAHEGAPAGGFGGTTGRGAPRATVALPARAAHLERLLDAGNRQLGSAVGAGGAPARSTNDGAEGAPGAEALLTEAQAWRSSVDPFWGRVADELPARAPGLLEAALESAVTVLGFTALAWASAPVALVVGGALLVAGTIDLMGERWAQAQRDGATGAAAAVGSGVLGVADHTGLPRLVEGATGQRFSGGDLSLDESVNTFYQGVESLTRLVAALGTARVVRAGSARLRRGSAAAVGAPGAAGPALNAGADGASGLPEAADLPRLPANDNAHPWTSEPAANDNAGFGPEPVPVPMKLAAGAELMSVGPEPPAATGTGPASTSDAGPGPTVASTDGGGAGRRGRQGVDRVLDGWVIDTATPEELVTYMDVALRFQPAVMVDLTAGGFSPEAVQRAQRAGVVVRFQDAIGHRRRYVLKVVLDDFKAALRALPTVFTTGEGFQAIKGTGCGWDPFEMLAVLEWLATPEGGFLRVSGSRPRPDGTVSTTYTVRR